MLLIKPDRPYRIRPRSDQHRTLRQFPQMTQQLRSDSSLLADGADVGVTNQSHVLDLLDAHHAFQRSARLVSPERNTIVDLMTKFIPGHVWLRPAIFRDDAP